MTSSKSSKKKPKLIRWKITEDPEHALGHKSPQNPEGKPRILYYYASDFDISVKKVIEGVLGHGHYKANECGYVEPDTKRIVRPETGDEAKVIVDRAPARETRH